MLSEKNNLSKGRNFQLVALVELNTPRMAKK
jgi:hypothetical protein